MCQACAANLLRSSSDSPNSRRVPQSDQSGRWRNVDVAGSPPKRKAWPRRFHLHAHENQFSVVFYGVERFARFGDVSSVTDS